MRVLPLIVCTLALLATSCQDSQLVTPDSGGEDDARDKDSYSDPGGYQPGSPTGYQQPPNGNIPPTNNGTPANLTNGSGGPKGAVTPGQFGGNGRYIVWAPVENAPGSTPHGLLVLLHGSRKSSYERFMRDSGENAMIPVAQANGLIAVSVLAPNGSGWNEGNQVSAAQYLHNFITQNMYTQYNIDKDRVYFSGQSSGGGFLATHFVPSYANEYGGGAFFQCGTGVPNRQIGFSPLETTKQKFKIHMEITTGDGIWTSSYRNAVPAYRQLGLQVTADNSKSGGHCAFDQAAIIRQYLPQFFNR